MTWVLLLGSAIRLWFYSEHHRKAVVLVFILFVLSMHYTNSGLCPLFCEILGHFLFCRCGKEAQLGWLLCEQSKNSQKNPNSSKVDIE